MSLDLAQIGIEFQTSGLDKGTAALKNTEQAANRMADAADKISEAFRKTTSTATPMEQAIDRAKSTTLKAAQQTDDFIARLERQAATFGKTSLEIQRYDASMMGMTRAQRQYTEQLLRTAEAQEKASQGAVTLTGALTKIGAAVIGIAAVYASVNALTKSIFDATVIAERLRIGLDFASGGSGKQELAFVTELSNRLGLSLESTASSYMSFTAASKGTSLEGAASKAIFESVAKASAVMGLSSDQSAGAMLALQQMMSKGTVQAEELRGQLGERLPGAFQIAARSMGLTTQELGKLLESGQLLAADFLPKFAAQLEAEIGGSAEKAANRLGAATARMETAIFRLKVALGESGIAEYFAAGLNRSTSFFNAISTDVEKLNSQGALRQAAADVNELSTRQTILKNGLANGFYGKHMQPDLDAINEKLAIAKQAFRDVDQAARNAAMPADVRSNFPGQGNRTAYDNAEAEAQKKAATDLIEVRQRLAGVNKQYLDDLAKLKLGLDKGVISEKDYIATVSELAKKTYDSSAAGKEANKSLREGASAAKASTSQYTDLMLKVNERIELASEELKAGRQLTEAEKQDIKLTEMLDSAKGKISASRRLEIETAMAEAKAKENLVLIQRKETEEAKQISSERQRKRNADYDQVQQFIFAERDLENARNKTMRDSLQGLADETAALSMTNAEREVTIKLREIERQGLEKGSAAYIEYADKIRAAVASKETVDAGIKSQVGMWQTIEGAAKDTFLSIFDSGKSAFTRLKDTLKNGLYALLYEITVKKWLINIAASVSGAGVAQQALGATGGAGGGGGFNLSGLTGGANPFTNFGDASLNFLNQAGGKLFDAGLEKVGSSLIDTASSLREYSNVIEGAGDVLGYAGALYSLSQGNYGAAAGSAIGTYFGGPIGAAIGSAIGGALFDGKLSASKSTGDLQRTYSASGAVTSESSKFGVGGAADAIDGIYSQLSSLQKLLGAKGAVEIGFSGYSGNGNKNPMGNISGGGFNSGEVPVAELGLAAQRVILAALQSSEMPKGIAKIINSIDPAKASAEQITELEKSAAIYAQSIKAINTGLNSLQFDNLKNASFEAVDALVVASGGLDGLRQNLTAYFDNFYSEEERRAQKVTDITGILTRAGVSVTEDQIANITRTGYRALVESVKEIDGANAPAVAALYAMGGAIASINPEADSLAVALEKLKNPVRSISDIAQSINRLESDGANLQVQKLRAGGNDTQANALQKTIDTKGFTAAEVALYDFNASLTQQIKVITEAKGLQDRLTAATDTTAQAAARARNAIDPLNKTLYDSVLVAEEKKGLEEQLKTATAELNALTDTSAQALERQRNALNASNQALFDQVQKVKNAGKSEEERIGLQKELNTLTDTATQALKRQRDALNESNRALFDQVRAATAAAAFKEGLPSTIAKYNTPAVNNQAQYVAIANQLKASGVAKSDYNELAADLQAATKDQIKAVVQVLFDGLDPLSPKVAEARLALMGFANQLADLKDAEAAAPALTLTEAVRRVNATTKTFEQIVQERISLEDQLNAATDTNAQALARQRAALDESNRALFYQLQVQLKAKENAAERKTLQDQLNALTDTAAQAITRQRDALDASNRALFDSLQLQLKANATAAERKTLQDQLNSLTDTAAQALTRQRDALDASNRALFDSIQAAEKAKIVADERKTLQDQLNALTDTAAQALTRQRDALDESNRALFDQVQLQTKGKEIAAERKTLQDEYDQLTLTSTQLLARQRNALDSSNRALFDQVQAIKAETTAKELATKGSSDAFSALQKAVDAQRKIVQAARDAAAALVTEITSVFDILKSSVKDLYGTVDSTSQMQASQGRAFISQALATAQSTGYLPESKALTDAINAAKGDSREFASQFEKDFATLTLAGDLSQLEGLAKTQLTAAEQALKVQDDQLLALTSTVELAQKQLDAANGINTSVLSLKDALLAFANSLVPVANPEISQYDAAYGKGSTSAVGVNPATSIASGFKVNLTSGYAVLDKQGNVALGVEAGWSAEKVAAQIASNIAAFGADSEKSKLLEDWAKKEGIPGFAVGTNYVPYDMLAQVHKGETIIPAFDAQQFRSGSGMGGNTERLESLVEGLTAEVQRLQSIVNDGNTHQRRTADLIDNVTEGGANMRTLAQ